LSGLICYTMVQPALQLHQAAPAPLSAPPSVSARAMSVLTTTSVAQSATIVFAWGVSEDGQTGLPERSNVHSPQVCSSFLGVALAPRYPLVGGHSPLVAGSRNTLAIDSDGQVRYFQCPKLAATSQRRDTAMNCAVRGDFEASGGDLFADLRMIPLRASR
jgi:hypothetical protein